LQVERTLVIAAVTSISLARREFGLRKVVMSPVKSGTPTAGQAVRTAVMPTPWSSTSSPSERQPARAIPRARIENRLEREVMSWNVPGKLGQYEGSGPEPARKRFP
jgi:hypothetical protein